MKPRVYLAGGMKSDWHEKVIEQCGNDFIFYNPKLHLLDKGSEYTVWDLHHVRQSDILFAYLEESNPSGIGLSLEIGLAIGLNKTVIFIDEKSEMSEEYQSRFKILRNAASITLNNLDDGITLLQSFTRGIH